MHVYFSGIGGAGLAPGALIAKAAGYEVSGSDQADSRYIKHLRQKGIDVHIGQDEAKIAEVHNRQPIDLFVYTLALPAGHPEMAFCQKQQIPTVRIVEFINQVLTDHKLELIAVAGTHGKTTTAAMAVWLFKQLSLPVSYSVGAKLQFGEMGEFNPKSRHFIYEADEFGKKFLSLKPSLSLISGIDWDHPDIFPTREEYYEAFRQFLAQSQQAVIWQADADKLGLRLSDHQAVLKENDSKIASLKLTGQVNRQNAWLVASGLASVVDKSAEELAKILNGFPGLGRRFEEIVPGLYSDYAHTPAKIRGALQMAHEVAGDNVVVVYEGLHNTRQHFIKDELATLFDDIKHLYIVPSYLAREDKNLKLLHPVDLLNMLSNESRGQAEPAELNQQLKANIQKHLADGDTVLCLTAGGGGSLDEWLRQEFPG